MSVSSQECLPGTFILSSMLWSVVWGEPKRVAQQIQLDWFANIMFPPLGMFGVRYLLPTPLSIGKMLSYKDSTS